MDVIIDGTSLTKAASDVDAAIRHLALIGKRMGPLITELGKSGGLSSEAINSKYRDLLWPAIEKLMDDLEGLQDSASGLTSAYIGDVDEIDQFMY